MYMKKGARQQCAATLCHDIQGSVTKDPSAFQKKCLHSRATYGAQPPSQSVRGRTPENTPQAAKQLPAIRDRLSGQNASARKKRGFASPAQPHERISSGRHTENSQTTRAGPRTQAALPAIISRSSAGPLQRLEEERAPLYETGPFLLHGRRGVFTKGS